MIPFQILRKIYLPKNKTVGIEKYGEILLCWRWDAVLIMTPDYISDNLFKYQCKFDDWTNNTNNPHIYWCKDSEEGLNAAVNGDAFLN